MIFVVQISDGVAYCSLWRCQDIILRRRTNGGVVNDYDDFHLMLKINKVPPITFPKRKQHHSTFCDTILKVADLKAWRHQSLKKILED